LLPGFAAASLMADERCQQAMPAIGPPDMPGRSCFLRVGKIENKVDWDQQIEAERPGCRATRQ